jgi:hypothetical protein
VLEAHRLGLVEHDWAPLDVGLGLVVSVSRAAARVGELRLRYSARSQRAVGHLLTVALVDLIWQRAGSRAVMLPLGDGHGGPAADMAHVSAWRRYDCQPLTWGAPGALVAGEGKDWVDAPARPGRAPNYGGQRADGRVWQPLGYAHDAGHVDYSQLGRWVADACSLEGQPVRWLDVLAGHYGLELARLVGGPLDAR